MANLLQQPLACAGVALCVLGALINILAGNHAAALWAANGAMWAVCCISIEARLRRIQKEIA